LGMAAFNAFRGVWQSFAACLVGPLPTDCGRTKAGAAMPHSPVLAVGLMSGTSMDGVDAALIETDGERVTWTGPALTLPYDAGFREDLRAVLGQDPLIRPPGGGLVERLTDRHAEAVAALLAAAGKVRAEISVIGFHGHTVLHR